MMKKTKMAKAVTGLLAAALLCCATAFASLADVGERGVQANIQSCLINTDQTNVTVTVSGNVDMTGTDGVLYLVELQPYQSNLAGRTDYAATAAPGQTVTFTFPLNRGTSQDRLYSKFVVALWDGTKYIEISKPHYITNPEIVAANQQPFNSPITKKGLNIQLNMLSDAFDLGVKHVATNISFHQILGQGIEYQYDGKTYHFDKNVMQSYDETISALSGKGMMVTAIILNGWSDSAPDLIYPGTQKNSNAFYYMFNAKTENGLDQTRAIASFLAERYNGSNPNHGKISNWIIGNEINNQQWNYVGPKDIYSYIQDFQEAFRVFYTAIKSTSANDRVYFSLDYNWNNEIDNRLKYGGKAILDAFNGLANEQGQMEWGLSYHPYPCPVLEPEFWDDDQTGLVLNDINSPIINFKNLTTLTDYMAQDIFRAPSGEVRPIILTEQGFTAISQTRGAVPEIQAAAFAYSYYLVDSNPHIDAYILSRQVDAPLEVRSGMAFGLWECEMDRGDDIKATKRRKIWQVFRDIDKKKYTLEASEFAKPIVGVEKWSDIIPNFRWRSLEN